MDRLIAYPDPQFRRALREELLDRQGGICAACGTDQPAGGDGGHGWHLDHCHDTGWTRGVLCAPCNQALGLMEDDPERLRALAVWIEAWHLRLEDGDPCNAGPERTFSQDVVVERPRHYHNQWGQPVHVGRVALEVNWGDHQGASDDYGEESLP